MLNYLGSNHEDSYCISKDHAQKTTTSIIKELSIIIPPETKVLQLEKEIGKKLEGGEILTEFTYQSDLDDYLEINNMESEIDGEDGEILSLYAKGHDSIKLLSTPGEIVDIKIYINRRKNLDKTLINYHNKLIKETKAIIGKLASTIPDKNKQLTATDNLNLSFFKIGKHKLKGVEFIGARVVYSIKQEKELRVGDKLSNRYGAKGVISKVLEEAPVAEHFGKLDVCISPVGVFSRNNLAMLKEIYIGKIFYYLNRKVKEMANDTKIQSTKISKLIVDVYSILSSENVVNSIKTKLDNYKSSSKLKRDIKDDKLHLTYFVEPFTNNAKFEKIKLAAEVLDIDLEEKVWIPELQKWSQPVPVGISYFETLEHYSDVYSSIRGAERYQSLTGQPTKGKSQMGGQTIGNLDLYAFLEYQADNIIDELTTVKSDDHRTKRIMINNIINTGSAQMPKNIGGGKTSDIFTSYMTAIGLDIK